jgi:hypothetical protein
MKIRTTMTALLLLLAFTAPVAGGWVDMGQEITDPEVVVAGTGDSMIVWSDLDGVVSPTSVGYGVFARLYDASGEPKGDPFFVPRNRAGDQIRPQVAADARGNFIVAWQGGLDAANGGGSGGDGDGAGVFAQRFDRNGARLGLVFRLSRSTAGDQLTPNVAMASDGSFVAVWQDCTGTQRRCSKLHAARFSPSGVRQGEELEIPVLSATSYPDGRPVPNPTPHVVIEPGGFAIGWTEQEACYKFQYEKFPVMLHFTDSGQPVGKRYRLDDGDCEDATGWSLDALTTSRPGVSAAFFNGERNSFQLFEPDGDPAGARKVVGRRNPRGVGVTEYIGDAAMASNGDFAVVWVESLSSGSQPTAEHSFQVQFFNALGRPLGGRIQVGLSSEELFPPAVAFAKDGSLIVVWGVYRSPNGGHHALVVEKIQR